METIETDYLVVGAGASGMAFADTFVSHSDASVLIVDRREQPGGHWNDSYPFVRLHQPSAFYGVDSRPLEHESIEQAKTEDGFAERATGAEVATYYHRVLREDLLPTGRVRFCGRTDYKASADGRHRLTSIVTGQVTTVKVHKKLVDATYMESRLPNTHTPSFTVAGGARLLTPCDLVNVPTTGRQFTVIGGGKTSMDTCCWLLDQNVDPDLIRWIRPRDSWIMNRRWFQPGSADMIDWLARQREASAEAADLRDLFHRFETAGVFERIDPSTEPDIYRGAILSDHEIAQLQTISNVIRFGHVTKLTATEIVLEHGTLQTARPECFVDCTATGLPVPRPRPVFDTDRITIQWLQLGIAPFSAAMIGLVEAIRNEDAEKNRLCQPNPISGEARDLPATLLRNQRALSTWMAEPDISSWLRNSRLNPLRHLGRPPR